MKSIKIPSRARNVVSIRLSPSEQQLIEEAAATRPEYPSRFVREAALEVARRMIPNAQRTPRE